MLHTIFETNIEKQAIGIIISYILILISQVVY